MKKEYGFLAMHEKILVAGMKRKIIFVLPLSANCRISKITLSMYSFLLIIAALIGIDQLLRPINNFSRTIISIQVLYIILTLFAVQYLKNFGFALSILAACLIMIYAFTKKNIETKERNLIVLSAFPVLIARILTFMNWPYVHLLGLTMIVPISLFFLLMLPRVKKYQNEIGFLAIMTIAAIIRLSKAIDWMY